MPPFTPLDPNLCQMEQGIQPRPDAALRVCGSDYARPYTLARGLVRCFLAAGISSSWSGMASLAARLAIRLLQHAGWLLRALP